ncbi:hypothetical protein M0R72_12000 [Candidatus Pacearchaeota archaeon]|jgi:hypothetical protein|nr:hypothetical protein [Candidatus Pacearchaeota archaeon]
MSAAESATVTMQMYVTGHMSADAVIGVLMARCDELLDQMAEKDRTISLQAALIETTDRIPLEKIQPWDLDRLDTVLLALRSDPRPIWGACIESMERVMKNIREAGK